MALTVIPSERSESRNLALVVAVLLFAFAPYSALAAAPPDPSVRLYDTGAPLPGPLTGAALAAKQGWKAIPEGTLSHVFQGDAVLRNDRLMLVLRASDAGADVYSASAAGMRFRAAPAPAQAAEPWMGRLASVRLLENSPGAVMADAVYRAQDEGRMVVRYRLAAGEAILEIRPGDGTEDLVVVGDIHDVVVPDFLGDDMAFTAGLSNGRPASLPAENMFLNLIDGGNAIVMCAWQARSRQVNVLFGKHPGVVFSGCESHGVKGKPIWLAFLDGPGLWHERPAKFADKTTAVTLDFQPPFPAKWRASFVGKDGVCESITFEQPPEKAPVPEDWRGPVIIYPIDRSRDTPLTTILPMDVLRSTLGVGPCQYILDAEGLGGDDPAPPDAVVGWIERLVKKKRAARSAEEIEERLHAMLNHLAAARARIDDYAAFGKQVRHVCREAAKQDAEKEAVKAAAAVLAICDRLDHDLARGRKGMQTPDEAAKLAREIASSLEKPDALAAFQKPATALRAIGHAFVATLARSRMAARRMKAYCRGAKNDVAKTVETMAERMLRPSK